MKKFYDSKFDSEVVFIERGEYFVSEKEIVLTTVLGSCVAICLFDEINKIAGMNHYLLPEPVVEGSVLQLSKATYGIHAIELMINKMIALGAKKNFIKAKIFGGGVMYSDKTIFRNSKIGEQNVEFARIYLKKEGIPVMTKDVCGNDVRKIYFNTSTTKVKLYRLGMNEILAVHKEEETYISRLDKEKKAFDKRLELFNKKEEK